MWYTRTKSPVFATCTAHLPVLMADNETLILIQDLDVVISSMINHGSTEAQMLISSNLIYYTE